MTCCRRWCRHEALGVVAGLQPELETPARLCARFLPEVGHRQVQARLVQFGRGDLALPVAVGGIGAWTWGRGMENASTAWKIATILMLAGQLAFYALSVGVLPG